MEDNSRNKNTRKMSFSESYAEYRKASFSEDSFKGSSSNSFNSRNNSFSNSNSNMSSNSPNNSRPSSRDRNTSMNVHKKRFSFGGRPSLRDNDNVNNNSFNSNNSDNSDNSSSSSSSNNSSNKKKKNLSSIIRSNMLTNSDNGVNMLTMTSKPGSRILEEDDEDLDPVRLFGN